MARKDEIFKSFLRHELILEKYGLSADKLPTSVRESIVHESQIVKLIANLVDTLESNKQITDQALRTQVNQLLNETL